MWIFLSEAKPIVTELLYIDLEQTVIENWRSPLPINLQLRRHLEGKQVRIFSFALCDKNDLRHFAINIHDTIEATFGCKIIQCILMEDVCRNLMKTYGDEGYEDYRDYMWKQGKQDLFMLFAKSIAKHGNKIVFKLWDDMVSNAVLPIDNECVVSFYKV